jgi:hypothetical protein
MTQIRQMLAVVSRVDSALVTEVALIPRCEECHAFWLPADQERWHAYWIDNGPEDRLLFYCSRCAEREFGDRDCS